MKAELPEVGLGDLVLALLAGTMAGLRDRLAVDGFGREADLVADLVDITDDYLTRGPADDEDEDEDPEHTIVPMSRASSGAAGLRRIRPRNP